MFATGLHGGRPPNRWVCWFWAEAPQREWGIRLAQEDETEGAAQAIRM